ncbi:MAG: thioredoxin [Candidatus Heimdallarchaeota archaeon]|nr:thioredoxin [Candidatus Heimdallarchaeota archaeon]
MGKIPDITFEEFEEILQTETKPIVVDTWAPWCGPCKGIEPYFEQLSEKYANQLRFVRMNMDTESAFAQKHMISSLPTFVVFKDGKPFNSLIGAKRDKLKSLVEKAAKGN